jgi:hypothetical protein
MMFYPAAKGMNRLGTMSGILHGHLCKISQVQRAMKKMGCAPPEVGAKQLASVVDIARYYKAVNPHQSVSIHINTLSKSISKYDKV